MPQENKNNPRSWSAERLYVLETVKSARENISELFKTQNDQAVEIGMMKVKMGLYGGTGAAAVLVMIEVVKILMAD